MLRIVESFPDRILAPLGRVAREKKSAEPGPLAARRWRGRPIDLYDATKIFGLMSGSLSASFGAWSLYSFTFVWIVL